MAELDRFFAVSLKETFIDYQKDVIELLNSVTNVTNHSVLGPTEVTIVKANGDIIGSESITIDSFLKLLSNKMDPERLSASLKFLLENSYKIAIDEAIERYSLTGITHEQLKGALEEITAIRPYITAKNVTDRLGDSVRDIVVSALETGKTINELKDITNKALTHLTDVESIRLATTESTMIYNMARFNSFTASEYETKIWATAGDEKVRDSHSNQNKLEIPINDRFPNGLLYPGDQAGGASEVVHCRCILLPGAKKNT